MKVNLTQNEITALISCLEDLISRYESEAVALLRIDDCPSIREMALERLGKDESAKVLLDKLLRL